MQSFGYDIRVRGDFQFSVFRTVLIEKMMENSEKFDAAHVIKNTNQV